MSVVSSQEADFVLGHRNQSGVGDGNAVRIAQELECPVTGTHASKPWHRRSAVHKRSGCSWTTPASFPESGTVTDEIPQLRVDRAGDGNVERTWQRAGGTIEWLEKNSCVAGVPPACAVEVGSS